MGQNMTDDCQWLYNYTHPNDIGEGASMTVAQGLSQADGGLGDGIMPHHAGGMMDTPIQLLPSKATPEKALFRACGYHDWNNRDERAGFKATVKSALSGIFDGSKTWFRHSESEKEKCLTKVSSLLMIKCVSTLP